MVRFYGFGVLILARYLAVRELQHVDCALLRDKPILWQRLDLCALSWAFVSLNLNLLSRHPNRDSLRRSPCVCPFYLHDTALALSLSARVFIQPCQRRLRVWLGYGDFLDLRLSRRVGSIVESVAEL